MLKVMMSRIDRLLAAAIVLSTCLEVVFRNDLPSRPATLAFAAAVAAAIDLRRKRPLPAMLLGFGAAFAATTVERLWNLRPVGPYTAPVVLLLPYTLARWGTGREVTIGALVMAATWFAALLNGEMPNLSDAVGAAVFMLFPLAIGGVIRFRAEAQARAVSQARLLEREQLARELHDSVAHHMVAIALQAQAAQAVLTTQPAMAKTALAAIEDESKRTLGELRELVGALRVDDNAERSPSKRISDLTAFAQRTVRPHVEVELLGNFSGLSPAIERAVFRLAQESMTNASKHARHATKVLLRIATDGSSIRLLARDDGDTTGLSRGTGFGLVGMAERTKLLGGSFEAGPLVGGGWQVAAVFPREGGQT